MLLHCESDLGSKSVSKSSSWRALLSGLGRAALFAGSMVLATEVLLRLQQAAGPLYDLEMKDVTLAAIYGEISEVVNHKPRAGTSQRRLSGKSMFGDRHGYAFEQTYDELGIRQYGEIPAVEKCTNLKKMLFLGDSFIEGYDDRNSLPYIVVAALNAQGACLVPLNAGYASYSPAIFVPQVRALIGKLKPDYVVVSIDETDLYDDNVRYKRLIVRDEQGRNVGVKSSSLSLAFLKGLAAIREDPLYISRLIRKLYHSYVAMPALARAVAPDRDDAKIFEISRAEPGTLASGAAKQVEFFKANIAELFDVLATMGPGLQRVAVIRHPHLQHLKADVHGRVWNSVVRDAALAVSSAGGVKFYDSEKDLRLTFGQQPEKFYWSGDMHFTFEGLAAHSGLVAAFLARELPLKNE